MRSLAYIEKIKWLEPIVGADRIEKATILGWEVIVKRGEFKVGDLCVFAEIDSIFPEGYPCFEFLKSKKFRIKTLKLKNTISQGIAFPLSILKDMDNSFDLSAVAVGLDVTDVLKITKYDPEVALDQELVFETVKKTWWQRKTAYWKWKLFGFKPTKSNDFPTDVPKTDETRVQKMAPRLEEHKNKKAYVTEKVEGCSGTIIHRQTGNWFYRMLGRGHVVEICSRNRVIFNSYKDGKSNHHIFRAVERYDLLNKIKKMNRNLAIQFETIGPKIQGNIYKIPDVDIRVFLMYDLDKQNYLPLLEMKQIASDLRIPLVPIIENEVPIVDDIKHYVEFSKGYSAINSSILREGIVIRLLQENFSFKSINPEYLLHQELDK